MLHNLGANTGVDKQRNVKQSDIHKQINRPDSTAGKPATRRTNRQIAWEGTEHTNFGEPEMKRRAKTDAPSLTDRLPTYKYSN